MEERHEKSHVLTHMMQRYQPEGGYEPIGSDSSIYRTKLDAILLWIM